MNKLEGFNSLKEYLNRHSNSKICILDNNIIDFFLKLKNKNIIVDSILNQYDLVLIPFWVMEEVNDSDERKNYIKSIKNTILYEINEKEYVDLCYGKELEILKLFLYSISKISQIKCFINKNFFENKNDPLEDILYSYLEWIDMLYKKWPLEGNVIDNGRRLQKKNAGEISITVLSHILSLYYPKLTTITIFTFDKDCYDFVNVAKEKIQKDESFKNMEFTSITFKSNDFILFELVNNKIYSIEVIKSIINNIRNPRRTKFSIQKRDGSFEENYKLIDNEKILKLIEDDSLHIIF